MNTSPITVLIVEENDTDYTATLGLIEASSQNNYSYLRGNTAGSAQTLLLTPGWDIAFVPQLIGECNGHELIQYAREHDITLPIVMVTNSSDTFFADGVDCFSRKELTPAVISRIIRYGHEHHQTLRALREAHITLEERVRERTVAISRIQRELALQVEQQFAIAQLGQIALSSSSLDDIFNEAVGLAAQILHVPYVAVLEKESENLLTFQSAIGWPRDTVGSRNIPITSATHAGYAFLNNVPIVIQNIVHDTRITDHTLLAQGINSGICIPIQGNSGPWGVLCAHSAKRRRFTHEEASFLQSVTTVIALSIERNRMEEVIRYQGSHDPVTGLPNRVLIEDRLEVELARARRTKSSIGILFLDLDNFKYINNTFGHTAGDMILSEVSVRLQNTIKEGVTLGRFGGDEFIIVIPDIGSMRALEKQAESVFKSLQMPFTLEGQEFIITTSIGLATFPHDGDTVETLIRNADTALYHAKDTVSNSYKPYLETMSSANSARVKLENELRRALERKEFEVWYQPIVDIKVNKVVSAEALLRWEHPTLGLISPAEFLPLAEELGLIVPLGEWAFHKVASDIVTWQKQGIKIQPVGINISAQQFAQPDLVSNIESIIQKTEVNPRYLEIEVTESMAMQNIQLTIERLQALAKIGLSASLDDFGTGHSSLNYLKQLPVNKLKIDQSFMADCVNNVHDAAIVRAIISLAHSLGLKVVAEGVENQEQLAFLLALNCDTAQGFLFSRAMVAEEFITLLGRKKIK